jgi:iron complex transport system substrate-binding protein
MERRDVLAGGLAAVLLGTTGCGGADGGPAKPDAGRIVSVGGDVTEILFALGLGPQVVAVDTTSRFPAATERLPKVGYLRGLGAEGLLSLAPSAIVAAGDAGPPPVLAQLRQAGVKVVQAKSARAPEDVLTNIALIAGQLDRADEGRRLARTFGAEMAAARTRVASYGDAPRALFLLAINAGSPNAAGRGTAADAMIGLAGGSNAAGHEGYKALSPEAAVAARPDVVLMMAHAIEAAGGVDGVAANPAIAATPAGQARRIVALDGAFHLGFGPRLPAATTDLAELMRA